MVKENQNIVNVIYDPPAPSPTESADVPLVHENYGSKKRVAHCKLFSMTEYLWKLLDKSRELLNWSKWTYLKAPGFGVPALPIGYPGWLTAASSYTTVYNTLNFPVASMKVKFSKLSNQYGWPILVN